MAFPDMENSDIQNTIVAGADQQGAVPLINAEELDAVCNPAARMQGQCRQDAITIVVTVDAQTDQAGGADQKDETLLTHEQKVKLFEELKTIFEYKKENENDKRPATCPAAVEIGWSNVRQALEQSPQQMKYLRRMLAAGLVPVLYAVTEKEYLFGDQRQYNFGFGNQSYDESINSVKQDVARFNALTDAEKQAAIEIAIQRANEKWGQHSDQEKKSLRNKLNYASCVTIPECYGINYWQALIYTAHFGGRPYTREEMEVLAQANNKIYDGAWQCSDDKDPWEVLRGDGAPNGWRAEGCVEWGGGVNGDRGDRGGVCVGGLGVLRS